jgi:hypothetical protein
MSIERYWLGAAALNGKIYVVGGWNNVDGALQGPLQSGEVYDVVAGAWIRMPNMPHHRLAAGTVVLFGKLYVAGGHLGDADQPLASVEVFTPSPALSNACTGNSMQLPAAQCNAWIKLFDATDGPHWNYCVSLRTDPCSCKGFMNRYQFCSVDGTTVITMYVCSSLATLGKRTAPQN